MDVTQVQHLGKVSMKKYFKNSLQHLHGEFKRAILETKGKTHLEIQCTRRKTTLQLVVVHLSGVT